MQPIDTAGKAIHEILRLADENKQLKVDLILMTRAKEELQDEIKADKKMSSVSSKLPDQTSAYAIQPDLICHSIGHAMCYSEQAFWLVLSLPQHTPQERSK